MNERKELTLKCDCMQSHFVTFLHWPDDPEGFILIEVAEPAGLPWKQRLKALWTILKGDQYVSCEVVLDKTKAAQLARTLQDWGTS